MADLSASEETIFPSNFCLHHLFSPRKQASLFLLEIPGISWFEISYTDSFKLQINHLALPSSQIYTFECLLNLIEAFSIYTSDKFLDLPRFSFLLMKNIKPNTYGFKKRSYDCKKA